MKPLFWSKVLPVLICALWLSLHAHAMPRRFFVNQTRNPNDPKNRERNLPKRQWKPFQKNAAMDVPALDPLSSNGAVEQSTDSTPESSFLKRRVLPVLGNLGQTGAFLAIMAPILFVMFGPFVYLFKTYLKGLIAVHGT